MCVCVCGVYVANFYCFEIQYNLLLPDADQ